MTLLHAQCLDSLRWIWQCHVAAAVVQWPCAAATLKMECAALLGHLTMAITATWSEQGSLPYAACAIPSLAACLQL